jgi:ferredoxin-nitrite reductase
VWQNLIISDIAAAERDAVREALADLGLAAEASAVRTGLVACTGNVGCKFSASDTKRHALTIAEHLDARLKLDQPLNIHLTGCPNSCAQHYIGDIGLLGAKIIDGETETEGYHIYLGGGFGEQRQLAREVRRNVPAAELPAVLEHMLREYLAERASPQESFQAFTRRRSMQPA